MRRALALLAFGCTESRVSVALPDLPPPPGRFALLIESEDGRESTGLLPLPEDHADVEIQSEGPTRAHLLVWTQQDLDRVFLPEETALQNLPIRRESSTLVPLPTLAFQGPLDDTHPTFTPEEPFAVNADWQPVCDDFPFPSFAVDAPCVASYCEPIIAQTGCRLDVTLIECSPAFLRAQLESKDHPRFESQEGPCTQLTPKDDSFLRLECPGTDATCNLDFYALPGPTLFQTSRKWPVGSPGDQVTGVALAQSFIAFTRPPGCRTSEVRKTEVFVFDENTNVHTSSISGCLSDMTPDPDDGTRFFAIDVHATEKDVLHIQLTPRHDLEILRRSPLPPTAGQVTTMALAPAFRRLAVARNESNTGYLTGLDIDTLEVVFDQTYDTIADVTPDVDGFALLLDPSDESILRVDRDGQRTEEFLFQPCAPGSKVPHHFRYDAERNRFIVASKGGKARLFLISPQGCGRASFFEAPYEPWRFTPWPSRPNTLLTLLRDDATTRTFAALYDVAEDRFLPGSTLVGDGVGNVAATDGLGRSWTVLTAATPETPPNVVWIQPSE